MDLVQYQGDRAEERPVPRSTLPMDTLLEPGAFTLIASLPPEASPQELLSAAETARASGARLLRGRAPRGGQVADGDAMARLMALAACGRATGLACVAEVHTPEQAEQAAPLVEMLQVGTDDPALLTAAARSGLPVLLERGPAATVAEWLQAADRLTSQGAQVALSAPAVASPDRPDEPGVDLAAVPTARERSGLPVVVDPSTLPPNGPESTATVVALTRAAAAVGADGVVVQAMPSRPASNGHTINGDSEPASLEPTELASLLTDLETLAAMSGRRLATRRIRYVGRS